MSDQVENGQNLSGQQPGQVASPEGGSAGSSPAANVDINALQSEISSLRNELRGLQSSGDKRQATVDNLQNTIQQYASLTGQQVDPNAIRNMRIDALLEGGSPAAQSAHVPAGNAPTSANSGQGQAPAVAQVDFKASIEALGMSQDAEVLNLVAQYPNNQAGFDAALMQLKRTRATTPTPSQPTGAGAVSTQVGNPPGPGDPQEVLRQQYQSEMKSVRPASPQALNLRRKYRGLGLQI